MRNFRALVSFIFLVMCFVTLQGQADRNNYLNKLKEELNKRWPENRTIKVVFHGHSVPAGYFKNGRVESMSSYPYLSLKKLNEVYPYALISPIVTAIGGEESSEGSLRFDRDVLSLNPDLLFIDYSLNDRRIGLEKSKKAWQNMIEKAIENDIMVILMTPTPDLNENILDPESSLAKHAQQVESLAVEYEVGLVNSYELFKSIAEEGNDLKAYMSQNNHINGIGHDLLANEILKWFLGK